MGLSGDTMRFVEDVFRSVWGRVLCVVLGVACVGSLAALLVSDGVTALWQVAPPLALVVGACWAIFWRPAVVVHDGGVRIVNVFRTVELPWPSIERVDTKYALTLYTAYGRFTAWAAPAPGAHEAVRSTRSDAHHLPDSAWTNEGSRPGDLPSTASGSAASLIRRRWETLRKAGHLENPRLERARPPIRWHLAQIAVGATLLGVSILGLLI
jgi:hypothetical protein